MNTKKIGICIQGPLASSGRDASTLGISGNVKITQHDATSVVKKYLMEAERLSIPIVVSTWETPDQFPGLTSQASNWVVNSLGDLDLKRIVAQTLEPSKYYQLWTTLSGFECLSKQGITHALKIRSDLLIDLESLYPVLTESAPTLQDRIWTPFIDPQVPYSFQDFYFGGNLSTLIPRLRSFFAHPEVVTHVHQDLFYRLLQDQGSVSIEDFSLFGRPWTLKQQLKCKELSKFAFPLPASVWFGLNWRGDQLSQMGAEHYQHMKFSDLNSTAELKFGLSVPKIIGRWFTDWQKFRTWMGMPQREFLISITQKMALRVAPKIISTFVIHRRKASLSLSFFSRRINSKR